MRPRFEDLVPQPGRIRIRPPTTTGTGAMALLGGGWQQAAENGQSYSYREFRKGERDCCPAAVGGRDQGPRVRGVTTALGVLSSAHFEATK